MDGHGTVASVGRSDHAQLAELVLARERLLLVSRLNAILFRQDPDLQQVNRIRFGSVAFAVADAATGAHALPVAGTDDRASAEGILVLDGALEDVGDDLHVAMRVRREALAAGDAVLVDDAQGSKTHVVAVVIFAER